MMALEEIDRRLQRVAAALEEHAVEFALVGGQAVAIWVATRDPAATRTTKGVDILLRRRDLPGAKSAIRTIGMEYFEVMGVGMFLESDDPNPKCAVHLLWAGERVRPQDPLPSPSIEDRQVIAPGRPVVALADLLAMKLTANRDHDRAHVRDMMGVGLVGRDMLEGLPEELARRLDEILTDEGL